MDFAPGSAMPVLPKLACYQGIGSQSGEPYCFRYIGPRTGYANDFAVLRGNGKMLNFGTATDLSPKADINNRAVKVTDASGVTVGWHVYNADHESTEYYNLSGRLQTITAPHGQTQTLTYSDETTPADIALNVGLLIRVTGHFNRQNYNSPTIARDAWSR